MRRKDRVIVNYYVIHAKLSFTSNTRQNTTFNLLINYKDTIFNIYR